MNAAFHFGWTLCTVSTPDDGLLTLRHVPVDRASTLCHGFPTKIGIFDNLISLIEFGLLVFYPCS